MAYEAVGKLHRVFPTEQKTSTFSAREFVVEIPDGNYPQYIKFQAVQDRCNILDNFKEGEQVKVHFDLRGREWQGKFFSTLNVWKIDRVDGSSVSSEPEREVFPDNPFPNYPAAPQQTQTDDLPF